MAPTTALCCAPAGDLPTNQSASSSHKMKWMLFRFCRGECSFSFAVENVVLDRWCEPALFLLTLAEK